MRHVSLKNSKLQKECLHYPSPPFQKNLQKINKLIKENYTFDIINTYRNNYLYHSREEKICQIVLGRKKSYCPIWKTVLR